MIKRLTDIIISFLLLILFSPIFLILIIIIFFTDFNSPFYISSRVGINGKIFKMIKFRSMKKIDSLSHIVSTSNNDPRITPIGFFIRKYKIDELSQLINVFIGNMTLVGPRPNVKVEVDLYNNKERRILSVKPGITDISSLVFYDLNHILSDSTDPNITYNQLIRPWKSRLALFYVKNKNFFLDIYILFATFISLFSRKKTLSLILIILRKYKSSKKLISVCKRNKPLIPYPPPGEKKIVLNKHRYSK